MHRFGNGHSSAAKYQGLRATQYFVTVGVASSGPEATRRLALEPQP
jgi:hypothetical protein